jgi:hypothetical protein
MRPSRVHLLATRIHDLGPRPLAELLYEILSGADPLSRIERYAALDRAIVAAVGASDLPKMRAVR